MTTPKDMLEFYMQAEMAVLSGQSITRNGRTWTRADLKTIQEGRREWEQKVRSSQQSASGRSAYKLARFV